MSMSPSAGSRFIPDQRSAQGEFFRATVAEHSGYRGALYRLEPHQLTLNLAPSIGASAIAYFTAKQITWHIHATHGLSSQVCCLNFLMPLATRPEALSRLIGGALGIEAPKMLEVECGPDGEPWFVGFEWIGEQDYLNEGGASAARTRGANATSSDAIVRFRRAGRVETLLIEWKYTESYGAPISNKVREGAARTSNEVRAERYRELMFAPNGPIRDDLDLKLEDFFWEPFYQLVRQQMLAFKMEKAREAGADRVRVLHISPAGNRRLHTVTSKPLKRFGTDAFAVFGETLVDPGAFIGRTIEQTFRPPANGDARRPLGRVSRQPLQFPGVRARRGSELMAREPKSPKQVESLTHDEASRRNIPTAEFQSMAEHLEERTPPQPAHYPRTRPLAPGERRERDEDLDPQIIWNGMRIRLTEAQRHQLADTGEVEIGDAQLVWRGKDTEDWSDLIVQTPPLYIQEKIHPKAIIDDLKRRSEQGRGATESLDLFADFNGLDPEARTEFYQHDQHWSNRMILGDSLSVMASLAQREALAGKVQCIYFDPPYGIKFSSNWQVSTISRDVKDGKQADISREPEIVKAFRDTWKYGIHSYLTYLRDRLTVVRDLLADTGSVFVQIGDENVHRVRAVMDEVFGACNAGPTINYKTTSGLSSDFLAGSTDHIIWYFKNRENAKFRRLFNIKNPGEEGATQFTFLQSPDGNLVRPRGVDEAQIAEGWRLFAHADLTSTGFATTTNYEFSTEGRTFKLPSASLRWKTTESGMRRLIWASRLLLVGNTPRYKRMLDDFPVYPLVDLWSDTGISGFAEKKVFVVQTSPSYSRCR